MAASGYLLGKADLLSQCAENKRTNRYYTIVYIRKGAGLYSVDSSFRTLNGGDLLILPPWVDYSFRSEDLGDEYNANMDAAVLRFDEAWLDNLTNAFPTLSSVVLRVKEIRNHLSVHGLKWMKFTSLFSEIESCDAVEQPVRILGMLRLISTSDDMTVIKDFIDNDSNALDERLDKIDRYISCNFREKITLQDISDYVGMSRTYFSIFFKEHYKEGFSDYLNRKRVGNAINLLLKTNLPISAVSEDCGFSSVQYFTRTFNKIMGKSPGAYRKR